MSKLTPKEREKYEEAEEHLRKRWPSSARAIWEVIKPTGAPFAVIAGFIVLHRDSARVIILTVNRNGTGWEIFAAPGVEGIADSFQTICEMWNNPNQAGA